MRGLWAVGRRLGAPHPHRYARASPRAVISHLEAAMAANRKKDKGTMESYGWMVRFVRGGADEHRIRDPRARVEYFGQRLSQLVPFFEENDIAIASKQVYTLTLCI